MPRWLSVFRTKATEFVTDEGGQSTSLEYALFAAMIGIVCNIALTLMYESVRNIFAKAPDAFQSTT